MAIKGLFPKEIDTFLDKGKLVSLGFEIENVDISRKSPGTSNYTPESTMNIYSIVGLSAEIRHQANNKLPIDTVDVFAQERVYSQGKDSSVTLLNGRELGILPAPYKIAQSIEASEPIQTK